MPYIITIDGVWGSVIIPAQTAGYGSDYTGSTGQTEHKDKNVTLAKLLPPSPKVGPVCRNYDPELAAIFSMEL